MDLLFAVPWYLPAIIIAVGVAVWVWGNNRMRSREKRIGIAIVLFAVVWAIVSYLVDTPSEIVDANTRQFVKAVLAKDKSQIGRLLDADATAYAWDRQQIIDGAVYYADETGLKGARIFSLSVEKEGQDLVSYLTVWSEHTGTTRFPVTDLNSQWKLEWVKVGKQWLLRSIIPLQIGQTQRDEIERTYLARPVK